MDLRPRAHYVARAMELLLALLSLLTAATGALGGARAPEAGVHQAAQVAVARQAPRVAEAARPAARAQKRPIAVAVALLDAPVLAAAPPLYADRLIE